MAESPQFIFNSKTITVGKQPMSIFPDGAYFNADYKTLNVICLGVDANWNGQYDEGEDELPSWWKIKNIQHPDNPQQIQTVAEKVMDLSTNWGGLFPFRCANSEDSILFVPHNDFVVRYNIVTTQVIDTIYVAGVKAASTLMNNIFFSVREYENPGDYISKANYVINYSTETGQVVDTIFTGYNVQKTIPYIEYNSKDTVLAVLCEGTGGEDSYLEFYNISTGEQIERVLIGALGNDIAFVQMEFDMPSPLTMQLIVAVVSNSHKLQVVDAQTYSTTIPIFDMVGIPSSLALPTTGYDIAREVAVNDNADIFITSYNGKIYKISPFEDAANIDSLEVGTATEGITAAAYNQNDVIIAYTKIYSGVGTYEPGNEVVIGFTENSCIKEEISQLITLTPNPVAESATLCLPQNEVILSAMIIDQLGNSIAEIPVNSLSNTIKFDLPKEILAGVYYLFVKTNNGNGAVKFIINK